MQELRDRVAVITGAGSGIGRALALACADEGMRVVAADIEADAAEQTAAAVRGRGVEGLAVPTNVADRAAVERLAEQAYARFGAVHLLCNNAGVLVYKPLPETTDADWQWVLSVNLFGVINGIQAFMPRLLAQGGEAHIVNTASIVGLAAYPGVGLGAYTTSKFAIVGLSESLRDDLAPHGIGVSVLCPGPVRTQISTSARNRPPELGGGEPPPRPAQTRVAGTAAMEPEEVARKVLRAVRANQFYIITHPDTRTRGLVEEHIRRLLAAFDAAAAEQPA